MLRLIFLFLLINLLSISNAQGLIIKSLRCYSSVDETAFPIISNNEEQQSITIDFDIQTSQYPNLAIHFRFCDADWRPYDNVFLLNPIYNTENNIYLERLPLNIKGAQYHYKGTFPNQNVTFPFSGKWKYFIVDQFDRRKIYAEGKFFVVNPEIRINTKLFGETLQNRFDESSVMNRTVALQTSFILPDSLFHVYVKRVEIFINRKMEYPIIIEKFANTSDHFFEWNASNRFSFLARNIYPMNEYRSTDTRDYNLYNNTLVHAKFGEIETSDFFSKRRRDYNGGTFLLSHRNENAEYLDVQFRIRPPEDITKPIFLVGSFTNWKVLPEFEMFDDNGLLNLTVELKRGYHEYQYVTGDLRNGRIENIDWNILEGNFYETQNEYHIFLYYEEQDKGIYDKIIGYSKITGGAL